jgi:hypothetical protein
MLLVTADPPLAQQASLRPTTASRPWSSPKKHKNRFCYRGISTSSQKPTTSAPTNSSPSPTVSPLHLPAGRRRVTRAHPKHSPFRGGGGMVWQYARNPHSLPLLPPEKDRVCHPTNRYPASPRKKIASANRPRAVRNRYPASPRIRLHRQQVMDMEMRESRADAGNKRIYDSHDRFGRSSVFEGKKTGEKGGCQVARVRTCRRNEKHTPIINVLDIVSEGGTTARVQIGGM